MTTHAPKNYLLDEVTWASAKKVVAPPRIELGTQGFSALQCIPRFPRTVYFKVPKNRKTLELPLDFKGFQGFFGWVFRYYKLSVLWSPIRSIMSLRNAL